MSRRELIDPEARVPLDALLEVMPGGINGVADIVQRRAAVEAMNSGFEVPENPNVSKQDRTIPGPDGEPDITVRVYRPVNATGALPGVYFIHGGGMILGNVEGEGPTATLICDQINAVVVSVEYRLSPEHPHPAPVEDCYAGLVWMAKNAPELGFDPDRLAVYGASAARAEDVAGLPPAFIDVGTVDLFRDEDIAFAQRLMAAGVPTELHVHPGSYHAAETFAPDAAMSKRIWAARSARPGSPG